jgi:hypothetical protein
MQKDEEKMKKMFDKRDKYNVFKIRDLVLKLDKRREHRGKHGKFDNLWTYPFKIESLEGENTFGIQNLQSEGLGTTANVCFLKPFFIY